MIELTSDISKNIIFDLNKIQNNATKQNSQNTFNYWN